MKRPMLTNFFGKMLLMLAGGLLIVSCQNDSAELSDTEAKLMDGEVNLLDEGRYGCATFDEGYLKGIHYLTPQEYVSKIGTLRPDFSTTQKQAVTSNAVASSKYLPTPPVGNQGSEGSCVGWGVGYVAHSITRYLNNSVHQNNWPGASRSAAYVYNQIKLGNCGSGSYPDDAMNLIKNQGQCSDGQMPYVEGGCYTQPTNQQRNWAAGRKSSGWFYVNPKSVSDIKYYLSQNYPVAACFNVNQSFYDIRLKNYVWSKVYGSRKGGHCVCIVGYDDATGLFKVQNSWGPNWGRRGYFYITYNNITKGALTWAGCILPNAAANTAQ